MSDIAGNAQYDAARANWGGSWRMPTEYECQELVDTCKWEWVTVNGVNGCKVTGPNGNNIFLPAAGCRDGSSLDDAGSEGYYWSPRPCEDIGDDCYDLFGSDDDNSYGLYVESDGHGWFDSARYYGRSVRPVLE